MSKHENLITDKKCIEYQLEKLNCGIEQDLKEALLDILFNQHGLHPYAGLPVDKTILYYHLCQFKKAQQYTLKSEITQNDWDLLCPATGITEPRDWSVKLIIIVIINVLTIPPPAGGWNQKVHSIETEEESLSSAILSSNKFLDQIVLVNSTQDHFDLENWMILKNILTKLQYSNMERFEELFNHSVNEYKKADQQQQHQSGQQQQHFSQQLQLPQQPPQKEQQSQSQHLKQQQQHQSEKPCSQKQQQHCHSHEQPELTQISTFSKKKEPVESCESDGFSLSESVYDLKQKQQQPAKVTLPTEHEEDCEKQKNTSKKNNDEPFGEKYNKGHYSIIEQQQMLDYDTQATGKSATASTSDVELSTVKELAQSFAESTRRLTKTMKQLEMESTTIQNETESEGL